MSGFEAAAVVRPGERLRAAREQRGLGVEQVAESLRLDAGTVQALERGDYARIGAPVFVRGFLRRYAELVGESAGEIELMYRNQPEASAQPDLAGSGLQPMLRPGESRRLGVRTALIATIVLAAVAGIWWSMRSGPAARSAALQPGPATASEAAAPGPGSRGAEPGTAAPPAAAVAAEPAPAALPPLPRKLLELSFGGDSWTEVYDARGYRLYFGFGHAGDTMQWKGVPPFRMVLGNASVVSARFDGAPVELPASPPDVRQRLLLTAAGEISPAR